VRWLTWVWLKFLYPIWNAIPAWVESWKYDKHKGRDLFLVLRGYAPDTYRISNHMDIYGFQWTQDPLGGLLDFHSLYWVTCARGKGDCDDWANLWYHLLKYSGKVQRVYTKKKNCLSGHAMVIFTRDGSCHLLSNLQEIACVPERNKQDLLKHFFGTETDYSVIY